MKSLAVQDLNRISIVNSTTQSLTSAQTFTGIYEEVYIFASISITFGADVAGTIYADFSTDGKVANRQLQLNDGTTILTGIHTLIPITRFFRVRFVNGVGAQSSFYIQTLYNINPRIAQPTSRITQAMGDYTDVLNTRSVIVAKNALGDYENINSSVSNYLSVCMPSYENNFQELRTSSHHPIFSHSFSYDTFNTYLMSKFEFNGALITVASGTSTITTDAQASSRGLWISKKFIKYNVGASYTAYIVARFHPPYSSATISEIGVVSSGNGYEIGYTPTDPGVFSVGFRYDGVETWIGQTDFNLDVLDGTGQSGVTLDTSTWNLYRIEFQNFGSASFSIKSTFGNRWIRFHVENNINGVSGFARNPNQFICNQINNFTDTTSAVLDIASVAIYGSIPRRTVFTPKRAFWNEVIPIPAGVLTPIFSVMVKSSFQSQQNRQETYLNIISASSDGNKAVDIFIYESPVLTTPTWIDYNTNNSTLETDIVSATQTGGELLMALELTKNDSKIIELVDPIVLLPGTWVTISALSSATSDVSCSFTWSENL
jgi:hypothetical protein